MPVPDFQRQRLRSGSVDSAGNQRSASVFGVGDPRQRSAAVSSFLAPYGRGDSPASRRRTCWEALFYRRHTAWLPPLTIFWTQSGPDVVALTPKIVKDGTPDQRAILQARDRECNSELSTPFSLLSLGSRHDAESAKIETESNFR